MERKKNDVKSDCRISNRVENQAVENEKEYDVITEHSADSDNESGYESDNTDCDIIVYNSEIPS